MPAKIVKYKEALKELNLYGNLDELPQGWRTTWLTVTQLKKLKIPNLKVIQGWKYSGIRYARPELSNAYPGNKKYREAIENYQPKSRR